MRDKKCLLREGGIEGGTDGETEGWTDGRTNRRADGGTDERRNGRTDTGRDGGRGECHTVPLITRLRAVMVAHAALWCEEC